VAMATQLSHACLRGRSRLQIAFQILASPIQLIIQSATLSVRATQLMYASTHVSQASQTLEAVRRNANQAANLQAESAIPTHALHIPLRIVTTLRTIHAQELWMMCAPTSATLVII